MLFGYFVKKLVARKKGWSLEHIFSVQDLGACIRRWKLLWITLCCFEVTGSAVVDKH